MGIEFVNITVNTFNLYKTSTKDYGTVAIVGAGGTLSTDPVVVGSYTEANTLFGTTALGIGVKAALLNGAAKVIAVDSGLTTLAAIEAALGKIVGLDIQVVALAGLSELADQRYISQALVNHVNSAGIARVGVFQLAAGENASTMPTAIGDLLTANSSRIFGIAHNSTSDVACAVAGLVASLKPWESPLLKPLTNIVQTSSFSSTELDGLKTAQINPLITPTYVTGNAFVLGSDYTQGTEVGGIFFLDTRRVIDDITYKIKAGLTDPNIIGQVQITKPGLGIVIGRLTSILQNCVTVGEIEGFEINFPIINALAKDATSRSPGEEAIISTARSTRVVEGEVSIAYAGVLHQININVKMTV